MPRLFWIKTGLQAALFLFFAFVILAFAARSFRSYPTASVERERLALRLLEGLRRTLREENGGKQMQRVFPEGACFTYTLYGLAWTNLARADAQNEDLRRRALAETLWVLEQSSTELVAAPFVDTQVRNGVFWLGQRNLLLAQTLEILPEKDRPEILVKEFHENSKQLAEAFLAAPVAHLDSYPSMSWPADNVTALVSLLLHDALYETTNGQQAYEAWKTWTLAHPDPLTSMPTGYLHSETGRHIHPARGCANSWNLALLQRFDPQFVLDQYALFRQHFALRRLGFLAFREYPVGAPEHLGGDVDSGPIIWGVGMTATGVGLAAASAVGDIEVANDIHALAEMWGFPRGGADWREVLWGALPVGDAFLAFGYSFAPPEKTLFPAKQGATLFFQRLWLYVAALGFLGVLTLRGLLFVRSVRRRREKALLSTEDAS